MASQPSIRRRVHGDPSEGINPRLHPRIDEYDTRPSPGNRVGAPIASRGRVSAPELPSAGRPSPRFAHNLRLWALGGPCLGVLLLLGGRPTALVAAFGVMACYCFDLADNAEGAIMSLWGAVIGCMGTLALAGSALGVAHVLTLVVFVALVGLWATLQFRSIYRDEAEIARFLERLLFACVPLPAATILTWAGVTMGGAPYAAPCLALAMYAAVGLYAVPLRSALGGGGAGGVHGDSARATVVLCGCMLSLPTLVQIAVDRQLLLRGGSAARTRSLLRVATAAALPWPLLLSLRPSGVLWWAAPQLRRRLDKILNVGASLALLVLCETSKSLVLLPTFRPFLYTAPPPPYDSLLASGALYSLVAAWLVQGAGINGRYAARALSVASVRCMGLLLGVEQRMMPLFDFSTLAVSSLAFSGRRDLKAYMVGVAGLSSLMVWFLWQTVWHLAFSFRAPVAGRASWVEGGARGVTAFLSIQQVSVWCGGLALAALLVPGLSSFGVPQVVVGVVLSMHAVLLILLEMTLIKAEVRDPWGLEGLFPLPLVAVTGFLGVWTAVRLVRDRGLDPLHLWLPGSVNASKVLACVLAILEPAEPGSSELSYLLTVVPFTALVMASTAPFSLFWRQPATGTETRPPAETRVRGGRAATGAGQTAAAAEEWSGPMLPLEAGVCLFLMAFALWECSGPVITPFLRAVLGAGARWGTAWGGQRSTRVSTVHVVAFCGAILALYALGMVSRHFPDCRTGRRSGAALLVASMALLVLQPGGMAGADGGGGGGGLGGTVAGSWREPFKQSCSVAIAGAGVLALTGILSPTKTLARRALMALALGVPVGTWSALSSTPGADTASVALSALGAAGTYFCAILILLEAVLPRPAVLSRSATRGGLAGRGGEGRGEVAGWRNVLPELHIAAAACMPATGVVQAVRMLAFGPIGRRFMGAPVGGAPTSDGAAVFALATAATGHAVIALAFKLLEGGAIAEGFARTGGSVTGGAGTGVDRRARLIPVMGNASAIIAAAGAFLCCWVYLPGEGMRALAAVPSCAFLLMLQDDGRLFRGTGFNFAVPLGALSVAWAGSAAYYIVLKGCLAPRAPSSLFLSLSMFGGIGAQAVARAYSGALNHFHGALGAVDSRRRGEAAVALRAVSFWTSDSPWQPLWNLILLGVSFPAHAQLALFLWGGQGSVQRSIRVLAALAINILPVVAGDLTSINLMGLVGLVGGGAQLWFMRERQATGRRFI